MDNNPHPCVGRGGFCLITNHDQTHVLVSRRLATDTAFPNKLQFPGGGMEPGETWEAGVKREVDEETGLVVGTGIAPLQFLFFFTGSKFPYPTPYQGAAYWCRWPQAYILPQHREPDKSTAWELVPLWALANRHQTMLPGHADALNVVEHIISQGRSPG